MTLRCTTHTTAKPTAFWLSAITRRTVLLGFESRASSAPWTSSTPEVWREAKIPDRFTTAAGCRRNVERFSKYGKRPTHTMNLQKINNCRKNGWFIQRILTWGEVSLYGWRPVYLVWIQLLCLCWINNSFTCLVKSKAVKQEVSRTVVLPPMYSDLYFALIWVTYRSTFCN